MNAVRSASLVARRLARSSAVSRTALRAVTVRNMAAVSGGSAIAQLASDLPHMDAIRYEHKNVKWSFKDVNFHSDSLACGLLEQGFQPGDVVLSWLPSHFAEQHILQFACSKAGFVLYTLDPAQAITDPEGAKEALAKALVITEANVLITQDAGSDVNYSRLVKEVIPEIRIFDISEGEQFLSPRFPHLRLPIHTGFENDHIGMITYKNMLVSSGETERLLAGTVIDGSTPLMGELVTDENGLPAKGKVLTNAQVQASGIWPVYNTILKKEYQEIEGVGVVF